MAGPGRGELLAVMRHSNNSMKEALKEAHVEAKNCKVDRMFDEITVYLGGWREWYRTAERLGGLGQVPYVIKDQIYDREQEFQQLRIPLKKCKR